MTENALSVLIVIFPHNSNKPRPRTKSCGFSDLLSLWTCGTETCHFRMQEIVLLEEALVGSPWALWNLSSRNRVTL